MRRAIVLTMAVLVWTVQAGAQFVAPGGSIPVVANIPGEEDTFWRSDVSIFNLDTAATSVTLVLFPELTDDGPAFDLMVSDPIPVPGGGQVTLRNVVTGVFGLRNVKGGLSVLSNDFLPLVLGSRTYTDDPEGGTYGQNVEGVVLLNDTAWVAGVQHDGFSRTNVGVFLNIPPSPLTIVFSVTVKDGAGEVVGSGSLLFDQAGLQQKSLGTFGVSDPLLDGTVEFHCSDCADQSVPWFAYASVVDQATGDAVYRAAIGRQ